MIEKSLNEKHALAHIGFDIAESRPPKKGLQVSACPHPLEVLWLFNHVLKTALYQLKAVELVPDAETSESVGWQNFGKMLLVFGCIGSDFCKKICVLQHFSKSTRFSS